MGDIRYDLLRLAETWEAKAEWLSRHDGEAGAHARRLNYREVATALRSLLASHPAPVPGPKVLACRECGWTAEPCAHEGARLEAAFAALASHPAPPPSVSRDARTPQQRIDLAAKFPIDSSDKPRPASRWETGAAPSHRSEAEPDCVCGHPYLAHVGVHHGCIGIDCGPECVDECQGAGCHCTRYRPSAPVPAESDRRAPPISEAARRARDPLPPHVLVAALEEGIAPVTGRVIATKPLPAESATRDLLRVVEYPAVPEGTAYAVSVVEGPDGEKRLSAVKVTGVGAAATKGEEDGAAEKQVFCRGCGHLWASHSTHGCGASGFTGPCPCHAALPGDDAKGGRP